MVDLISEEAKVCIRAGKIRPYDANDDDSTTGLPQGWRYTAARGIVDNMLDRRDIKFGFRGVDEETRKEIILTIAEIIRQSFMEWNHEPAS